MRCVELGSIFDVAGGGVWTTPSGATRGVGGPNRLLLACEHDGCMSTVPTAPPRDSNERGDTRTDKEAHRPRAGRPGGPDAGEVGTAPRVVGVR